MAQDRYGLPLTTTSPAAREAYLDGVDRFLAARAGAEEAFDRALAADPGFALAHAARARALGVRGRVPEAREAAARARALTGGVTRREAQHVEAVGRLFDGDAPGALAAVRAHVVEFPRDALVLQMTLGAFGLLSFSGRADHLAQAETLLDGLAPHYGDDWWFDFARGWAQTETGRPDAGRRLHERSLALKPDNANAAHGLAHVFFETGDAEAGVAFLERWLDGYPPEAPLHCHLHWHLALYELAHGRPARALGLFRRFIRPSVSLASPLVTLCDGASLLWRLGLHDTAAGPADWREVRDHAERAFPRAGQAFVDVHAALAYAASGDAPALARRIAGLEELDAEGRLPAGDVAPACARAAGAFARRDWAAAADTLAPAAGEVVRLGGSHAQREVIEDTLIVACLRGGRGAQAEALLAARLGRRPSQSDTAWLALARAPGGATA